MADQVGGGAHASRAATRLARFMYRSMVTQGTLALKCIRSVTSRRKELTGMYLPVTLDIRPLSPREQGGHSRFFERTLDFPSVAQERLQLALVDLVVLVAVAVTERLVAVPG